MKFLCDQMCSELGRWLRTAGYDTEIITTSFEDRKIFEKAVLEKRLLITRDKHFKEIDPEGKTVIFLIGESLDEWTEQLKEESVDWLFHPFSRCLQCNTPFEKITGPIDVPQDIPEDVTEFWSCPTCKQLFWLGSHTERMESQLESWQRGSFLSIGVGGDLMIGRLVNEYLNDRPPSYVWGDLHPVLRKMDCNLVNLETTLTHSEKLRPKVFNFKADPEKVAVLTEGPIHVVNLANNHILDFSEEGLLETLQTLDRAKILHVGAGKDLPHAKASCIIEKKGIKIGFLGCTDNEPSWKAKSSHPGTNYIEVGDLDSLRTSIAALRMQVDLLILSIHWGPNMRKKPPANFRIFAHEIIDLGVDILHGHSAHIFQGVEIYKKKLILYDTGDFVDDYAVDPILRNDRSFFFIVKAKKQKLISLRMIPVNVAECQVNISDENEPLDEMEKLCKELKTFPTRKKHELFLSLDS
ncbi:MAG: putative polyglutamine synthesis accessory protein [Chlamydiae bacterium]|nr:putative polyglutamine synthesis accessory protein [Chlamydiota bacterium]